MINILSSLDLDFEYQLSNLISWESSESKEIIQSVKKIIDNVKQDGDKSVLEYTMKFDSLRAESISELFISKKRLKESFENLEKKQKDALSIAAKRIKSYHQKQVQDSWSYKDEDGTILGQKIF